jgi:hypothetical protein
LAVRPAGRDGHRARAALERGAEIVAEGDGARARFIPCLATAESAQQLAREAGPADLLRDWVLGECGDVTDVVAQGTGLKRLADIRKQAEVILIPDVAAAGLRHR